MLCRQALTVPDTIMNDQIELLKMNKKKIIQVRWAGREHDVRMRRAWDAEVKTNVVCF